MTKRLLPTAITDAIKADLDRPRWLDQFAQDGAEPSSTAPVSDEQPDDGSLEGQR